MPRIALALVATATAVVAVPAVGSSAPERAVKTEVVKVGDDFYAPSELRVKSGTKVKWKWLDVNLNPHNVVLTDKHPNGVKRKDFKSSNGAIGIKFARRLEKAGDYGFICTFHRTTMKLDIEVKKN